MGILQVIGCVLVLAGFLTALLPLGPAKWIVVIGLLVAGHLVLVIERYRHKRAASLQRGPGSEDLALLGLGAATMQSSAVDACHDSSSMGSGGDCGGVDGSA
jgi:hypothetical protein